MQPAVVRTPQKKSTQKECAKLVIFWVALLARLQTPISVTSVMLGQRKTNTDIVSTPFHSFNSPDALNIVFHVKTNIPALGALMAFICTNKNVVNAHPIVRNVSIQALATSALLDSFLRKVSA